MSERKATFYKAHEGVTNLRPLSQGDEWNVMEV